MKTLWSNTWRMILAHSRGRREWLSFGSAVLTS